MIQLLHERCPTYFVDFGCADGFYAVGMARAVPGISVQAFDFAPSARSATASLAAANGIKSLVLRGAANEAELLTLAPQTSAILCDIEGAEVDVLTHLAVRSLAHATIIVEVHEGIHAGALQAIVERCHATHTVTVHDCKTDVGRKPRGRCERNAYD
jgi:precorrin-6B methylase 2